MSREMALAKLDAEAKSVKNKAEKQFAVPCINYMKERCKEDDGLCEDICKEEKRWEKCFAYITGQAKKFLNGKSGAVIDNQVFEWCEDYYRKLEKPEKASKVKKAEEKPKDVPKAQPEEKPKDVAKEPVKEKKAKVETKETKPKSTGKKDKNVIEGQMSIFDFMGV